MRVAVISDIHANRLALEAVLDDIGRQSVDLTVNLGDHAAGPLDPAGTVDILIDADFPTIRGNHDRWMTEPPPEGLSPVDIFALGTFAPRHAAWLKAMHATMSIPDIFMCHGTPVSDTDPWLDSWSNGRTSVLPGEVAVTAHAIGLDYPVLLCGHTHLPRTVRLRDGRLIVNPGSVGLQINHGSPDARYAIVERRGGHWATTLRAVPYDHEAAARQAEASGFPQWREALATGWVGPAGLFGEPLKA